MPDQPLSLALPPIDLYWMIEARYAQNALALLQQTDWRAHAAEFAAEQAVAEGLEARRGGGDGEDEKPYLMDGGTAVLSLTGPMTKRPQSFGSGTSTVQMRRLVRRAAADPDVKQIALVIDSPGGQVSGTHELAADVARAREQKRVAAYIEDLGASAAYWVASQADAIYANETAFVGSIGTYLAVADTSRMYENEGVKVHLLKTGPHKGAGYPGVPVTEAQLAHWQHEVDQVNETFLGHVSQGRRLPLDYTRSIADGRTHVARDAYGLGLIDGVQTLEAMLTDLRDGRIAARVPVPATGGQPAALSGKEKPMPRLFGWFTPASEEEAGGTGPQNASANPAPPQGGSAVPATAPVAQTDPLAAACREVGLDTPEKVQAAAANARFGEAWVAGLRVEAEAAAKLYYAGNPEALADALDSVKTAGPSRLQADAKLWNGKHDSRYGISATEGARRVTVGADPAERGAESPQAEGKEFYDRIRAESKARNGAAAPAAGRDQ